MIGQMLGEYRVVEQIGLGGMATVYKAYDASTDRYVAIKVLPERYQQDPTFLERFRREARAIARLEHIHILPVFAYGEDAGVAYQVMRYMDTGTLANRLQAGPLPLSDVSRLMMQISGALDHAHRNGVIHRDVKPSNVLLDREGNAYLSDFGIAKMVEGFSDLTGTGLSVGTPQYMSPEQCRGDKNLTAATDLYSLGVVLYQMVTGHLPFEAETPLAIIHMHLNNPLPMPRSIRPDLPQQIENVIIKAMAKDIPQRYESAGAMAADFAQSLDQSLAAGMFRTEEMETPPPPEPIAQEIAATIPPTPPPDPAPVPTPPPAASPQQTPRRRTGGLMRWLVIGGLLVMVLAGGGIVLFVRSMMQAEPEEPTPTPSPQPTATTRPTTTIEPTITLDPAITLAQAGVSTNSAWTPYFQTIGGYEMALVPVGCFSMGISGEGGEQCLDAPFWIDVTEVTNAQYGSTGVREDPDYPRDSISWFEAAEFCMTRGGRLPTEAEWEYAARGPDELVWTWGSPFDGGNAVYSSNSGRSSAPVGSKPGGMSWIGAQDMLGNLMEWTNSLAYSFPYDPNDGREADAASNSVQQRILRGGSYITSGYLISVNFRDPDNPGSDSADKGIRCMMPFEAP